MERRTRNLQGQSQIIFFFFMLSLAIVTMIIGGVITVDALSRASAALVPALVVGGLIGSKVAVRVRKDTFRVIVIVTDCYCYCYCYSGAEDYGFFVCWQGFEALTKNLS
jgi:uncharacterized membrane protein YfcA